MACKLVYSVLFLPIGLFAAVDFQREVRPILSDACFHCHGPDQNTRMAGLRLDTREGAFAERKTGTPIVAGKPESSLIYQRIMEASPAKQMPPAYSHKTLTPQQKDTLKRWIAQGAPWKEHWSFAAPVRPAVPAVKDKRWVRNPIDNFILAKLEAAGLKPAPEADRRTLARRLSLDVTGLPPDPPQVEAFVNDKSPNAYEAYLDKLFASEHYGEHRARYWLDAARYADTHGIHVDNYREMWPYRDWVIRAFNRNLPFDRFTIEQIAGDLLPDRTLDQQIASGFHRCNVTTNEAGVIVEEVEAIYAKDRVDTTGTVFLGLTIGCATCHDHKFDPIRQRDFYSMAAFFRNTTQNAMDGNAPDSPPIIVVPREEDRLRWSQLKGDVEEVKSRMHAVRTKASGPFDAWLNSPQRRRVPAPLNPADEIFSLVVSKEMTLSEGVELGPSTTPNRQALHFDEESYQELPNLEYFEPGKPFSIAVWFYMPDADDNFVIASQSDPDDKNRGWAIEIGARVPALRLTGNSGRSIQVRAGHMEQLKPGTWNHLAFTYDGSREQAGLAMYWNGRAIPTQGAGDQTVQLRGSIGTDQPLRLGREGKRYFEGGAIADLRIYNRVLSEDEALLTSLWPAIEASLSKDTAELTPQEREALQLYYAHDNEPEYKEFASKLAALGQERRAIRKRGAVTHVMEERTDRQPFANILYRGMYDQPRDRVEPNVPSALPPMPASFPRNRLGLAQWLVDSGNPLVSRVAVNRYWQEVFGTGIVKTAEDFGSQGEAPTHPELLDWLAVEFRESGWDIKKFYRLMLTSAAYRQAALITEDKLKKDPDNRMLSRGPRFRMDGEMVRDYALAASGLLTPAVGGPSVKPYQPDGVWETVAMLGSNTRFYKRDKGEKLYRRSLYTFWKRSAPPASMEIFNAPTRETCQVRRERTDTPLQALVTMNDTQFVEAARRLAEAAMKGAERDPNRQFDELSARLLARPLDNREREVATRSYKDYLNYYDAHPGDAKKLLAAGESKADPSLNVSEFAALTMVANQMLNLDEVLTK